MTFELGDKVRAFGVDGVVDGVGVGVGKFGSSCQIVVSFEGHEDRICTFTAE